VGVTFPLALWFGIHSLICVCNKNLVHSWQFWFHATLVPLHWVGFLVLLVVFWFIPDDFYNLYLEF
jgi:hypothetical protein